MPNMHWFLSKSNIKVIIKYGTSAGNIISSLFITHEFGYCIYDLRGIS